MLDLCRKFVIMVLFIFVTCGLFLAEPCFAPVTTPANPSPAPEIVSVVFHHNPVWSPPIYTTNPYTGEVTITSIGYWKANGTMEITIKNCPFTPYTDKNGNYINVYYPFFVRASNSNVPWSLITRPSYVVYQSDSDYTIFTLRYDTSFSNAPDILAPSGEGKSYDFRVQAVTGYFHGQHPYIDAVFEGEGSAFTEFILTIPVSDKPSTSTVKPPLTTRPSTPSTSDNYNNNSQQNPTLQSTLIIVLIISVCIITILLSVIIYQHKQRNTQRVQIQPSTTLKNSQ